MKTKNAIDVIGYVGKDPELKHTTGGASVLRFSVATTDRWKDKAGTPQERTEWHRVAFWGPVAERLANQLKKGALVEVEGSMRSHTWEKDGLERTSWEIAGRDYRLFDRRPAEQSGDELGDAEPPPPPPGDDLPL
jgi:single-strand DNA-binding protein